jgi:hypothetical protein
MIRAMIVIVLACFFSAPSVSADEEKTYQFDNFSYSLMNGRDKNAVWGIVNLKNGSDIVGYIYLTYGELQDPHLSSDKSYIVAYMPFSMLGPLLDSFRNDKQLQIKFTQMSGASVFYLVGQGK